MAFTVGEAARLEQSLLADGSLQTSDAEALIASANDWFSRVPGGRATLDDETFAFLCDSLRFPHDATVRALAAGALRILTRDSSSHPHRASFAARFAAKRIRAISGTAPLWSAVPLSPKEQDDANLLYEVAFGDSSYTDDELVAAVATFVRQYRHEPTMFGRLAMDLSRLANVLRDPAATLHGRDVARAALTYFAVAEDAIPDASGLIGLVDDAYVVQRAVAQISPQRGAIVSLLDRLVRREPFIRDVVFDAGDRIDPLSEFLLVNASLLLTRDAPSPGVALVVPQIGPLPVLVGFVRALREVHRHVNGDGWPEFTRGELLINPESGASVVFDSYGQLTNRDFHTCSPSKATHVCFFARPVGRDKSRSAYTVKCFRPVQDVVSFSRAHNAARASGGAAIFDRDTMRLGVLERLFGLSRPIVLPPERDRVVVVGPIGETRQILEELSIFRSAAIEVVPVGQAQIVDSGIEYRTWSKRHDGYGPILTVVRSTADASVLCDDPSGRVAAVIAPVRPDSSDLANLTRMSRGGVPVIAAIEQRNADSIEHFERSGFDCWAWDSSWLATVHWPHSEGTANAIQKYERRLREQANASIVASQLALPGLATAYQALRSLQSLSATLDSESLRLCLGEGFGLLLQLCRTAVPLNGLFGALGSRLTSFQASIARSVRWWPDEVVQLAESIPDEFASCIAALRQRNPKFDALSEWAAAHPEGQIICGRSFRDSLRQHLDCSRLRLVDRPEDAGAPSLVPAWLQKDRMNSLLFPPASSALTLLLYDPEAEWHSAAQVRYGRAIAHARAFAAARPSFKALPIEQSTESASSYVRTVDPDEFIINARRTRALTYLQGVGGDTIPARLVQFVGGYWAAFTELHRVHTVTHLVGVDRRGDEEIRESIASDLEVGDLVLLLRGTHRDALREEVDAAAPAGTRSAAATWQRALTRYAVGRSIDQLVEQLNEAGCRRTVGTVERWMEDDSMIGPRSADDVRAILTITRDGELSGALDSCLTAISTLRGLHVRMARVLAARVLDRAREWLDAGAIPEELVEVEDRLVLATVESIDPARINVPRGIANRLQDERLLPS